LVPKDEGKGGKIARQKDFFSTRTGDHMAAKPGGGKPRTEVEELLSKGAGTGGPAADALRRAAGLTLKNGELLEAIALYEQAAEKADAGPCEPHLQAEIELELGAVYEKELGRLDRAVSAYQKAFKLDPDNPAAVEAGRRVYRALGDWVQVARLYEVELETLSDPSQRAGLLVQLGLIRSKKVGDLVGAAVRLEEAVRLTDDPIAKEALASIYISPDFPMPPGETMGPPERAAQLFLELAEGRARRNDGEGEIAFLKRALGADPYHLDGAIRLEKAYTQHGHVDELRKLYRQDVSVPRLNVKRALLAAQHDDLDEAIEAVVLAHAEGDDASEAVIAIDQKLEKLNQWARMGEFRKQMLDAAPPSDAQEYCDRLVEIADLFHREHATAKQEQALRQALESDPAHAGAFNALADLYASKRDYGSLVRIGEAAVEAAPIEEQPSRLAALAEVYEKKVGDAGAAAQAWRRAEAIVPSQRGTQELRRLSQKQDRWGSVTQALNRELGQAPVGPARADVLKRLAQVHKEKHELDQARQLLEEALEIRPDDPSLYRALADLYEHQGDQVGVTRVLTRQLKASKEKVEKLNLLRRLAVIFEEKLHDAEGVTWAAEQILEFLPGDRDALKRLEASYERNGADSEEQLVAVLEKHAQAAATPAERVPVLHKLWPIYERREDVTNAVERLERVLKLDKSDAKAQDAIARLYEKQQRWADAALALERVMNRAGASPDADTWKRYARIVDGQLHDPNRAVKAWKEVLEKRPTDREALEAMAGLSRTRGDHALLAEVLERRQQHAEGPEAAAIAVERAALLDERMNDKWGAIKLLQRVLDDLDPRNLDAHAHLRKLERETNNLDGSLRIAERELFLAQDPARKLDIARDIARAWQKDAKDARRALMAWERVFELDGNDAEALEALSQLYSETGQFEKKLAINEHRLSLAEEAGDFKRATALNFELAMTAEEQLHDPERAFEFFRRAHDLEQSDGTLNELRRVAEAHGLWEQMCGIYSSMKGLEPRLRVAEIADEKLQDPKRAFAVLRGALTLDPTGETLEPEIERLSVRAADPQGLLEVYEKLIDRRPTPAQKIALLKKRGAVKETRLDDKSGAMDELTRAFRMDPDDEKLLIEIRRLADATSRWEDELAVEGFRFHRADGDRKLEIALEAAALVEEKVKDPLRAFRAYLRAFQLKPDDTSIRDELWRLARTIDVIDEKPVAPPPAPMGDGNGHSISSSAPPPPPMKKREREPTLEISLGDMIADSKPIIIDDQMLAATEKPKRDPTVELSIHDLVPMMAKKPPAESRTMELSISDVAVVSSSKRPPPFAFKSQPAPPPPPVRLAALTGPHSAWDELAVVLINLADGDPQRHFQQLVLVSEMWEKGAGDLDKAFESLSTAFKLDPDDTQAREALERLAASNDAWDRLVGVIDDTITESSNVDRAVRLLVDAAQVREKQGQTADAEERYLRALGIKPTDDAAFERLEQLYRGNKRLNDLASLLERRMNGLLEKLAPGEPRRLRALELASIYEQLGNTYEAIDAWKRVGDENPDDPQPFANLARLYEGVGQWSKVVESLTRELDVLDAAGGANSERARERRKRIGEIYERELELPDRAVEAYGAVYDAAPQDQQAEAALERLYEKLGRLTQLEQLLDQRARREKNTDARAALLERRAAILVKLRATDGTVEVLQELARLRPDDLEVVHKLKEALRQAGRREELAEQLRTQIGSLGKKKATAQERARLLVELGRVEAELGDTQEAQRTLEAALDLAPSDPQALAELSKLREGGSDWDGYAQAREREAEVAGDPADATRALVDAARVHAEKRNDDAAARSALEKALEKSPDSVEAMALLQAALRRLGVDDRADEIAEREIDLPGTSTERKAELLAQLGASHLRADRLEASAAEFREALATLPAYPPAVEGLADVAAKTGHWEEVEALLRDAAARDGVKPAVAAQLNRRLADAAEQQGRADEAYALLLEADRMVPGDLRSRLSLGENRYRANRFREAAQYLGSLADHPDVMSLGAEGGQALYHAAISELKLRRPEKVVALLERAVAVDPNHPDALGLLAERIIEGGDLPRAVTLLEQQAAATENEDVRAQRFERVADVIASELKDAQRACAAYERALEAAGKWANSQLLEKALRFERETGQLERAAETSARLLEREAPPPERARRLREAASLDAALGRQDAARERLKAALELDPLDTEALAGLSAMLVTQNNDPEAATLLTRTLPRLPAPTDAASRMARATLWMRLGECRERMRDARGATMAFEKALEADPSRRGLREVLLDRWGDDPAHDDVVRAHRMVLLMDDPLHVPSLRHMAQIEARRGAPDKGRRFLELLAVAGGLTDEERIRLGQTAPAERSDDGAKGSLDDADHQLFAHAEAVALGELNAVVWEGTASERAPNLESLGVGQGDRVSPVEKSDLALAYATGAKALGNRRTGLFVKRDPGFTGLDVVAHPPTAIIVGPQFAEGRAIADVRFLLGRALELARPEYVMAAALPRDEFARLFSALLRAFHPRHARRRLEVSRDAPGQSRDEEAAMWKRQLPYKVAKRLAELFAEQADTHFSSARWRRAVQHTVNRAGLLVCGDMIAAARVLSTEGDQEAIRELARFAASDDYLALRTKLTR
jgi:tetratricopeptide (TPR) repeat protein